MNIIIEDHDGTTVLAMDRPPLNALDIEALEGLIAALSRLAASPPARGAVIAGRGKAFTAGVDIRAVARATDAERAALVLAINRLAAAVYLLEFPVIAAFNGHAIGAGIVMGLACDRRIAATGDAKFGLAEVTAGIPYPAVPLAIVREGLAEPHRSRLVLGGESLDAQGALATGMVDEIVDPARLLPRAIEAARTLAAAAAFSAVKRQLRAPLSAHIRALLDSGTDPLLQA
jgi:enoyl-CoA hydratase/carnithine racemase